MNIIVYMSIMSALYLAAIGVATLKSPTIELVVPRIIICSSAFALIAAAAHVVVASAGASTIFNFIQR